MLKRALATEDLHEWLSVSVMHDCLTGIDGLYNPLLLSAVNDTEGLAAGAAGFAPSMQLNPVLDSGDRFGTVIFESAFAAAGFDCSEFPCISKIEYPLIDFADVEGSQCQDVCMPSSAVCDIRMILDA